MANRHVNKLVKAYGKVQAFKNLPLGFKLAMIWYMARNGEAWTTPDQEGNVDFDWGKKAWTHRSITSQTMTEEKYKVFLTKNMAWFDKRYGHMKFKTAMVPHEEFRKSLLANFKSNPEMTHIHTLKQFQELYQAGGSGVNHKDASWPVIFDDYGDSLLQDGWHRIHCYLNKGFPVIPCIGYLPKVNYEDPHLSL